MRKILLLIAVLAFIAKLTAQNVQLHYDFGKDRKFLTSTVEMFKPDKWGNTFFFIDMNYNVSDVKGVSLAYWEIARALNLGKTPFAFHMEYNGGFGQFASNPFNGAYQINDALLGGIEYSYNNKDFSKGFTLQVLYKYIRDKHDASFQLTGVWHMNMLKNKLTFSGFADFWREDNVFSSGDEVAPETTKFVFLTEPQLWYNFTKNISLGGEIEIANNFGGVKGFGLCPTLAAKWNF